MPPLAALASSLPSSLASSLQSSLHSPLSVAAALPADLPSPTIGAVHLGPITLRAYALCILAGIVLAVWLTDRRLRARGGAEGAALDVSIWAVPFGIVGGRIYHVITTPDPYFGEGGSLANAVKIWEGGLGIWGAIAFGALGAWIGCRRSGVRFLDFVDAAAPGVAFAQAIGRWGNWFNNELYGRATDLPWGLTIYQWDQTQGRAVVRGGEPVVLGTYHPTFLYESLFVALLGALLLVVDRRWRLARGQVFALYVAGYPVGRVIIERMRTDEAELILGQRLNVWTSLLVFLLGLALFWYAGRRRDHDNGPARVDDQQSVPDRDAPDGTDGTDGASDEHAEAGSEGVAPAPDAGHGGGVRKESQPPTM